MVEVETRIPSYPKVYALGHHALAELFSDPVTVEEKVDGSQFSFGVINDVLLARSKGAQVYDESQGGAMGEGSRMFKEAVRHAETLRDQLAPNVIYRCEFLAKPNHNTLAYDRIPANGLVLFDVEFYPDHTFLPPDQRRALAETFGMDAIPYFEGINVQSADEVKALLDRESFLGGCRMEGVVFKNHKRYGRDGKFLAGKYVSEDFKEVHKKEWKKSNPTGKDIREHLADRYRAEGRWAKAVQHLRDEGTLDNSPRDIGNLMKEVQADLAAEETEAIKEALFKWAFPHIQRGSVRGLPEWYKARLLDAQFDSESA